MSKKKTIEQAFQKEDNDVITAVDLFTDGWTWFAVDKYGYIFCCRTEFTGHVPEFVIKSRKESEILYDYFSKFVFQGAYSEVEIEENNIFCYNFIDKYYYEVITPLNIDRSGFKKKTKRHNKKQGLQVHYLSKVKEENIDRSDFKNHPYHYKKINNPTNPIHFDQLPENIRKIMDSHRMTIDAHNTKYFFIPEIYQDASGSINKEARNSKLVCKPMRER